MDGHDVIVVGARVAGAATALQLARAGHDVLVVDRDRRGADTLSTHALMRPAVLQLDRWGLLDDVVAAGTPPQHRVVFHYGGRRVPLEMSRPLYAPRRTVLDPILVTAAERAGVVFRFGVDVTGVVTDRTGRVTGVRARPADGLESVLAARVVVGADGRRSRIARAVQAPTTHHGDNVGAAMYGYWSGVEAEGYEWAFTRGAGAGLIPTNDGRVCVYAGVPRDRFMQVERHDLDEAIHRVLAETRAELAERVAGGRREGPVRGFPGLAGWLRRPRGPGWALVGDAGYFKDPITAHGITDALRDAELLADDLHQSLSNGNGNDHGHGSYERVRNELSLDFFELTDRIASFDWGLSELQDLHLAMSDAMKHEYQVLARREDPPVPAVVA